MGAAESTSRTGINQEEEELKQMLSMVIATIAVVGVVAWVISRMLSHNTNTQGSSQTSDKKTWSPPPLGRFKLNTDATCHPDDEDYNNMYVDLDEDSVKRGPAACGGILRDHNRKWIQGFIEYIGVTDNFTAELHGIHKGLELLAKLRYKGAILETDSEAAYKWVNQPNKKCSRSPIVINSWDIIEKCRQLIEENNIKMNHVLEDANKCADKLADIALERKVKYKVIEDLPNEVSRFVSQDAKLKFR